jgi:hypothetical protein
VSFASEVTEKTVQMDVEEMGKPSIIRKPMKKERKDRRHEQLKKSEAPSL